MMYDVFILAAISMAYWGLATAIMVNVMGMGTNNYQPMQNSFVFPIGWFSTIIGFYWFFWKRAGQTIGMRAWRLKVVTNNQSRANNFDFSHRSLTHKQCLIRIFLAPISLGLGGLGYIWCLFNKDRAAWHDIISQTRVVVLPKE